MLQCLDAIFFGACLVFTSLPVSPCYIWGVRDANDVGAPAYVKKQLPRTHVLCTLKGPRNCRRIGRMRKKHARLLSRNKRTGLFQHRRLYKRMDRFQSFMQRKQCGISKEATDNPDHFDLVSREDRFSRHRFQGLVLRRMNRRIASSHVDCCFHDGPSWSTPAKVVGQPPYFGRRSRQCKYKTEKRQQQGTHQNLMRTLIHGLKTCLNQGGGIQALVDTLSSLSHPKKKTKLQKKREAQNSSKQGESLLWNGRPYQVTGNGWWYWVDDHKTNLGNAKTPTKGFQHEIPTVQHAEYGENSWITNLRFHDWDTAPTLVSIPQIKGSFKKGEKFAGNITEVWTLNDLDELISLWKTFEGPPTPYGFVDGRSTEKRRGPLDPADSHTWWLGSKNGTSRSAADWKEKRSLD